MKENYKEEDLDDFLSNLVKEEQLINVASYESKYNVTHYYVEHCLSVIRHRKPGWIGRGIGKEGYDLFGIATGMNPVVRIFLDNGGFVKEKEKELFDKEIKLKGYELTKKQIDNIKIANIKSNIALGISISAVIVQVIIFIINSYKG